MECVAGQMEDGMIDLMMTLAMAASAHAASAPCPQATTVAIEECQQRRLQVANVRLNAAYQAKMARLSPAARTALRDEERRWIASRDAACKVGADQGTAGPLAAANCLLDRTNARTRQLASIR